MDQLIERYSKLQRPKIGPPLQGIALLCRPSILKKSSFLHANWALVPYNYHLFICFLDLLSIVPSKQQVNNEKRHWGTTSQLPTNDFPIHRRSFAGFCMYIAGTAGVNLTVPLGPFPDSLVTIHDLESYRLSLETRRWSHISNWYLDWDRLFQDTFFHSWSLTESVIFQIDKVCLNSCPALMSVPEVVKKGSLGFAPQDIPPSFLTPAIGVAMPYSPPKVLSECHKCTSHLFEWCSAWGRIHLSSVSSNRILTSMNSPYVQRTAATSAILPSYCVVTSCVHLKPTTPRNNFPEYLNRTMKPTNSQVAGFIFHLAEDSLIPESISSLTALKQLRVCIYILYIYIYTV